MPEEPARYRVEPRIDGATLFVGGLPIAGILTAEVGLPTRIAAALNQAEAAKGLAEALDELLDYTEAMLATVDDRYAAEAAAVEGKARKALAPWEKVHD